MRAVKVWGRERVTVETFPDPVPDEGEVLVRVTLSALCGSELQGYRGERELAMNGGHEAVGVVVDARRSRRWREGERVGVYAVFGCGRCRACLRGQDTYCLHRRPGVPAHAELMAVPDHVCLRLPEEVPDEAGVLLTGDGLGVPFHVAERLSLPPHATVAVFGVGPVGLSHVLLQNFLGRRVIAVDVKPYRLALAQSLGAAFVINAQETEPLEALRELTGGEGADACLECAGRPETLRLALQGVRKGGTVVAVGENREVALHIGEDLIRSDITLMGSWYYHRREYPLMLSLYRQGLAAEGLITHRFPLEEAQEAFRCFAAGETGKVVLQPTAGNLGPGGGFP